ncbi:DNA repair helicase XPB [Brevibacillus fluminis]|uniref:DNA repair helicase XPB n=1 Tax=Brevibacillus fluminis TaxID=511487 RepID=UPI003F8B7D6E
MAHHPHLPLIVQSDRTVLAEVQNPLFAEATRSIARFAELEKSPDYIHTYKITPLSLWNAAASGMTAAHILDVLYAYSKFDVPLSLVAEIGEQMKRYGLIRLEKHEEALLLKSDDGHVLPQLFRYPSLARYVEAELSTRCYRIAAAARGEIKQELIRLGYPVVDLAGYAAGDSLPVQLKTVSAKGPFQLRPYQAEAIESFYAGGTVYGGSGVLVLPCGAGKTIIGIGTICKLQTATLILTTNTTSVRQWIAELRDKTNLDPDLIGEYTGERKEVKPITVTTYQMLTYRSREDQAFPHMDLFTGDHFGLVIYDEVHLLPAPVFRMTAGIQTKRRLGLTATLVREDGRESDVFSLVGPKKYDMPWRELEAQGHIAQAVCKEVRVPMPPQTREAYAFATASQKTRIAAENPYKLEWLKKLVRNHAHDRILVIGQYLDQLEQAAEALQAPLITGKVKETAREELYREFKEGKLPVLVVSKVANFAIDLPDANVAIQLSGTFGSRQEEAQRLGRILRPKEAQNQAHFYTVVTRDSRDQDFARQRQLFLVEQGYQYEIFEAD